MESMSSNGSSEPISVTNAAHSAKQNDLFCSHELSDGWQRELKLEDSMLQLFDAGLWTDVSFRCSNQSEENPDDRIHAHKIVLAARSPVFQAMFFGPCRDNETVITIQDTDNRSFRLFLRMLYSDMNLVYLYNDIVNVMEIAHKYQVQCIFDGCCRKLAESIQVENACSVLERALLYENQDLIEQTIDFIDANANDVLQSECFLNTSETCLTYILKGDTFYVKEKHVFERAIEWARQICRSTKGQVLRRTLGNAFYYLRTPTMPLDEFVACTKRKGYYDLEEHEDIVALIASTEKSGQENGPKCNSVKKRLPVGFEIRRVSLDTEDPVATNSFIICDSIQEEIEISPRIDVYLTSLILIRIKYLYCSEKLYRKICGQYALFDSKVEIQNFPVTVSIKIADTFSEHHRVLAGATSPYIELSEPLLLSAGKSVKLRISVTQEKISGFRMKSRRCFPNDNFKSTEPGIVCVKMQNFWDNAKVVHSLRFKCLSNRNES